jgi:hypothetical protein
MYPRVHRPSQTEPVAKDRASGLYCVLSSLLELSALAAPYIDRSTHHRRTAIHG